jgi:hypothetical protein
MLNEREMIIKRRDVVVDKKIMEKRKSIRDEHSRMAWELFQQVILHKNPYEKQA